LMAASSMRVRGQDIHGWLGHPSQQVNRIALGRPVMI
jgi:hypothetical protein